MLKAFGLRGRKRNAASQNMSHSSAEEMCKFTVETTSLDSRSVSSHDSCPPPVYKTPGFQQEYHQHKDAAKNTQLSLVDNASKALLSKQHETNAEESKWWNFDTTMTSVHGAQDELAVSMEIESASNDAEEEDSLDSFCSAVSNKHVFPWQSDSPHFKRQRHCNVLRSPLTAVWEEANDDDEEITFFPRMDQGEFVKRHRNSSSRNRGFPSSSRNNVLGASLQSFVGDTFGVLPMEHNSQHLKFMLSEKFDKIESATTIKASQDEVSPSYTLASMVHEFDALHFAENRKIASISSASVVSQRTNASTKSKGANSTLKIDRYTVKKKSSRLESMRKRFSSAFRSSSGNKSVSYSLSKGKNGMSKQERLYATSLLPSKPLLSKKERSMTSSVVPRPIPLQCFDQPLSILLLNPFLRIFEVVLVDFFRETTIGDALAKARAAASDKALSGQKYVSLCNRKLELAAPMLPVSLLIDTTHHDPDKPLSSSEKRELMEMRLLVAVPAGSSAKDCQHIRRVLWNNPKVQRWWKRSDPFRHPDESDVEEDSDESDDLNDVPVTVDQEHPIKAPPSKTHRQLRHRNERYQRLDD